MGRDECSKKNTYLKLQTLRSNKKKSEFTSTNLLGEPVT